MLPLGTFGFVETMFHTRLQRNDPSLILELLKDFSRLQIVAYYGHVTATLSPKSRDKWVKSQVCVI